MRNVQHLTVMTTGEGNLIQNRLVIAVVANQLLKPLASVLTAFTGWDE